MNKDLENTEYAKSMRYKLKKDGFFILTSCNCTASEMDEIFVGENLFKKLNEIKGYKSF